MKRIVLTMLALVALAGCTSKTKPDNSPSFAKAAIDRANAVANPQEIQLTSQTMVYECPKCGTDYDKPGSCPKDQTALVATQVAYICPADNQPVEHTGKCPRCNADARVEKTAIAANTP
jgi:hypothetical protein